MRFSRKYHHNNAGIASVVGLIAVLALTFGGWIANIFKFISLIVGSGAFDALFVGRALGIIVFPLGMILGYF